MKFIFEGRLNVKVKGGRNPLFQQIDNVERGILFIQRKPEEMNIIHNKLTELFIANRQLSNETVSL